MAEGSDRDPIVIVGAGPAGAALAWLLASRSVPTVLIERHSDFEREFRGEVMMPSGLAVLDELGIGELSGIPHQRPSSFEMHLRGRHVMSIPVTPELFRNGRSPVIVSQPALLEQLVSRCESYPCFRFIRGGSVDELVQEGGRCGGVVVRAAGDRETIAASLVVGADGRASIVRRRIGFTCKDRHAPMDIAWAKIPWPKAWEGDRRLEGYIGNGHLLIALPAPDGKLQLAWVIVKGANAELRSKGIEAWVEAMADHVTPQLASHLRETRGQISRPFLLKAATDLVTEWSKPGVLLIGDAAHTMSPVGAQGLNVAVRDSVIAANHLVRAWREGADSVGLDAAAGRVGPERTPEIEQIQRIAGLPPRIMLPPGPLSELLRSLVGFLATKPFARARAAALTDPFLYGTTDVKLEV